MGSRCTRLMAILFALSSCALASTVWAEDPAETVKRLLNGQTLTACDDDAEWPPFAFYRRDDERQPPGVIGYSVDVLQAIFQEDDIDVTVKLVPWKRCLREVQQGGRFQALVDATLNPERAKRFLVSRPYYTTRAYYFYSARHHPEGLDIQHPQDLKAYRVCGLLGYNYVIYGVPKSRVDTTTRNFDDLIAKLHRDRCDLFIEQFEIIAGFSFTSDRDYLADNELGMAPLPYMKPIPFHMMFARNELGSALKALVDQRLKVLDRSGRLEELLQRYMQQVALQNVAFP
ncbi:transporter substrate-binding domain-containing protein [Marinobacteraceae bacterium S3BR75-40.1]